MAIAYAGGLMAMIGVTGLAYDASQYYSGTEAAQHRADMVALAATVNIRDNSGSSFEHGVTYYLDDIGAEIRPYTSNEKDEDGERLYKTQFKVLYDAPEEGLLTTTVTSVGQTAILGLFNVDNFIFEADSVTSYQKESLKQPASVFFVLDNSGSMGKDDGHGNIRLDALKKVVGGFNEKLETITDDFGDSKYLRTALWAYSSANRQDSYNCTKSGKTTKCVEYITDGDAIFIETETPPHWGAIDKATIDAMKDRGGTDPSGALEHAKLAMRSEKSIHYSETKTEDLHRFVILMADGGNTGGKNGIITYNSLAECEDIKNEGGTIYTIGYAIELGSRAETFLKTCATTDDHYHRAENADILNTTFDDIGEDILKEVIRIRS